MLSMMGFDGFFLQEMTWVYVLGSIITLLMVGFFGSPLIVWAVAIWVIAMGFGAPVWLLGAIAVFFVIFLVKPLRVITASQAVMTLFKKLEFIPKISETERTALEAGVVWIEKDLFSGKPDFDFIRKETYPKLTAEEQAFMDNQVSTLCALIDPWKVHKTRELSKEAWDYIKKEKFFGMIIPKEYGGLGFSAMAHSEVVMKVSARSVTAGVTVMVPNSLGPAELLVHYGTDAQKNHYLPRLARGEDVPSFGLTEPQAGSDAGSITSAGIVFKGQDGKLYVKLNWNKRWITLAAVSSVIGLAFKLKDPENFLGKGEDVGITCALIPSSTPGVVIGRRHDPLGIPFYNCPTQGKDVVISIDDIVGGVSGVGIGWTMLMECLAAGRGISLPAQATGGAKLTARVTSAHSVIRKQFGVSIGRFEGIEEPLARIGGGTYMLEAMRRFTLGALDKGIKPPVITAMQKYYSTEMGRKIVNDGMDIMGGAGISMGPRNLLGEAYIAQPIGITVEGANILTRTLIVFGQGALRAHPYAFNEVKTLEAGDLKGFDEAFWGHIGHITRNLCRSIVLSATRGYAASAPEGAGEMAIYYRRLSWASATFAILADVAMGTLGGMLKQKEKITGRFSDILGHMYIATSVLRRFEAEGSKEEDLAIVHYSLKHCFVEIQKGFDGIFDNLKIPGLRWFMKGWLGAWSRINSIGSQATDGWSHAIATQMLEKSAWRDRLTDGIYLPTDREQQLGRLEYAMQISLQAEAADKKIKKAVRSGALPKKKSNLLWDEARTKGIISTEEYQLLQEADTVRYDAVQVDDFSEEQFKSNQV